MATQRSKPYPSINLEESVTKIKEVVHKLGNAKKYEKETFAQGLGYKNSTNGAFLRASAALIQYNLVQRDGNDYALSQLSQDILYPTNDLVSEQAVRDAAMSPQVFEAIYQKYKGQELPGLLPNILVAEHGILVGAKDKVVSIFKATMEFAGLLKGNRLIDDQQSLNAPNSSLSTTIDAESPAARVNPEAAADSVATTSLVKDFGEGRIATLKIPTDLDETEREKLANLIKNM